MFQMRSANLVIPSPGFTGVITVPLAGTPVNGGAVSSSTGFILKGHTANTNVVWVFARGLTKAVGFPLASRESIYVPVASLDTLDFDSEVNGERICFIIAIGN